MGCREFLGLSLLLFIAILATTDAWIYYKQQKCFPPQLRHGYTRECRKCYIRRCRSVRCLSCNPRRNRRCSCAITQCLRPRARPLRCRRVIPRMHYNTLICFIKFRSHGRVCKICTVFRCFGMGCSRRCPYIHSCKPKVCRARRCRRTRHTVRTCDPH